jgi:predicted NBD/HSP70 family sugar kinase
MSTTSISTAERAARKRKTKTSKGAAVDVVKRVTSPARVDRPSLMPVLQLLWREQRISRAEIARRNDLSRSTVSELIESLLEHKLVREVGAGESRGGRRPIVLEFRDDAYFILGVDMGAAHVSVCVTDLRNRVVAFHTVAHPVRTDPHGTRTLVGELVDLALATARITARRLIGVGMAVPSPVDTRRPDHLSEVVLPAWHGRGLASWLEERVGVPVLVDNDANLGALAESWWGAARGVADSAYIKVATGLGSGHIIRGDIYRGASGVAGEIGHMAIDPHGPQCVCGLRGCLATFVGTGALVERARVLLPEHPESTLVDVTPLHILAIEDAAIAGDPLAVRVIEEAADHLGTALASLINLMNPAVVSLGGSLARVGPRLFEPLRAKVRSRTLVTSAAAAEIVGSELGECAVALGAATLVLQGALQRPQTFQEAAMRRG